MAKYTPSRTAATRYIATLVLSPPTATLASAPRLPMMSTPRRLQRSARMPDGTSSNGTAAAYSAAITPRIAGEKPSSSRNSFSTGTHRAIPPVNAEA